MEKAARVRGKSIITHRRMKEKMKMRFFGESYFFR